MSNETQRQRDTKVAFQMAHWKDRLDTLGEDKWRQLIELQYVTELAQKNLTMPQADILTKRQAFRDAMDAKIGGQTDDFKQLTTKNERILMLFDIAGSAGLKGAYKTIYEAVMNPALDELRKANREVALHQQYNDFAKTRALQDKILKDSLDFAQTDARFAEVIDIGFGQAIEITVADDMTAIINKNTNLQASRIINEIKRILDQNLAIQEQIAQLTALAQEQFGELRQTTNETLEIVKSIDEKQNVLLAFVADQRVRRQAVDEAERNAQNRKQIISGAKASVSLLSTVIGFGDPLLGKQVFGVGNTLIDIADNVSQYVETMSKLDKIGDTLGQAVSSAVFTGNVVGTVIGLFSLFDQGLDINRMILDEIRAVRQDIAQLSRNMNERLDRIDKGLNTIYQTMNSSFNRLEEMITNLAKDMQAVKETVNEIQVDLVEVRNQLFRFERNLFASLSDAFQQDLKVEIGESLGFERRTGKPMSSDRFYDSESNFFTWATDLSYGNPYMRPVKRLDDSAMTEELEFPYESLLNLLAWYPTQWKLQPLSDTPLPNYKLWSIATQAYTQLALESPALAARMPEWRNRASDLVTVSNKIRDMLSSISVIKSNDGVVANSALFTALFENYKNKSTSIDKVGSLNYTLIGIEQQYLSELQKGRIGLLDLWGGANQPLAIDTSVVEDFYGLQLTSDWIEIMIPRPYLVARYLNLGTVSLNIKAHYINRDIEWGTEWIDSPPGKGKTLKVSRGNAGELIVDLVAMYNNTPVRSRMIKVRGDNDPDIDANEQVIKYWTAELSNIMLSALNNDNADELQRVTGEVDRELKKRQYELYGRILNEFTPDLGSLSQALKGLEGAKRLLDAYINLGLPRALEADDLLASLLHGTQCLPIQDDSLQISTLYKEAQIELPAYNVRDDMVKLMDDRREALEQRVQLYLNLINKGAYSEAHALLETTTTRLEIAARIIYTVHAEWSPSSLDFGQQVANTESASKSIEIQNDGVGTDLEVVSVEIGGANADDFTATPTRKALLQVGKASSISISISFKPTATGVRRAEVQIVTNAPDSPHRIPIIGNGV